MDAVFLIVAAILAGIGIDILRFPKLPPPTLQQDEEVVFGKAASPPYDRDQFSYWRYRYGGAVRSPEVRALAVVLIIAAVVLAAKGLGIV